MRKGKQGKGAQAALPLALPGVPSFQKLCRDYVSELLPALKAASRTGYRSRVEWAAQALPAHPTAGDIRRALQRRIDSGDLGHATANQYVKTISAVFKHGRQNFPLSVISDPTFKFVRWVEAESRPVTLVDAEETFARLLVAMPDARARAFLHVQRWQALRVGETLGIQWPLLDLDAGQLTLIQQRAPAQSVPGSLKCKSSAAKMPLHPEVIRALRAVRASDALAAKAGRAPKGELKRAFVFFYVSTCWHCGGRYKTAEGCGGVECLTGLARVCRTVSPESFPRTVRGARGGKMWHAFRHTLADDMEKNGAEDREIALMLRHGSIATTQTYMQAFRGRKVSESVTAKAWGAGPKEPPANPALSTGPFSGTRSKLNGSL